MLWRTYSWHILYSLVPSEHRLNITGDPSIVADHDLLFIATLYPSSNSYFQQDTQTRFLNMTMSLLYSNGLHFLGCMCIMDLQQTNGTSKLYQIKWPVSAWLHAVTWEINLLDTTLSPRLFPRTGIMFLWLLSPDQNSKCREVGRNRCAQFRHNEYAYICKQKVKCGCCWKIMCCCTGDVKCAFHDTSGGRVD